MSTVTHLGFQYSPHGLTTSTERTQAVANWPSPKSVKELRSFLGLANFHRHFVNKFADIAAPLNRLTSNKRDFLWTSEHQYAFDSMHNAMVSPPVLEYPTKADQLILSIDASSSGLDAVFVSWVRHCNWICQQSTQLCRDEIYHHREGMSSHCLGNSETPPFYFGNIIYPGNGSQVFVVVGVG